MQYKCYKKVGMSHNIYEISFRSVSTIVYKHQGTAKAIICGGTWNDSPTYFGSKVLIIMFVLITTLYLQCSFFIFLFSSTSFHHLYFHSLNFLKKPDLVWKIVDQKSKYIRTVPVYCNLHHGKIYDWL